jgi:hypothetical protein
MSDPPAPPAVVFAAFDRLGTAEEAVASLLSQGVRASEISVAGGGIYVTLPEEQGTSSPFAMYVGQGSGDIMADVEQFEMTRAEETNDLAPLDEEDAPLDEPEGFMEMATLGGDGRLTMLALQGFGVLVGDGPMARQLAQVGFDPKRTADLQELLRTYLVASGMADEAARATVPYVKRGAVIEVTVRTPVALRLMEEDLRAHEAAQILRVKRP